LEFQITFPAISIVGDFSRNIVRWDHIHELRNQKLRNLFGFRSSLKLPSLYEYLKNNTEEVIDTLVETSVCRNSYNLDNEEYGRYELSRKVIGFLRNHSMASWFGKQKASWNRSFAPEFSEIITRRGMAFTFNMPDASKLLNLNEFVYQK
jgi:hypothetical protein